MAAHHVRSRLAALISVTVLAGLGVAVPTSAQAAAPTATLGLSKNAYEPGSNVPLTDPVKPGDAFDYQLAASCSGLTEGCITAKTVDVLPADIVFLGADPSPLYTVSYDAATRSVTTTYNDALPSPPNPPNSKGILAGSTRTAVLHVRLDPNSKATDGSTITNTATASADNADSKSDSTDVTVAVPRVVTPIAGKTINPNSVIAQSGAAVTAVLSVRNGSSTSADISSLTVADTTKATWDSFNLTSVGPVTQFPPGSNQVTVRYCLDPAPCSDAQFVSGAPVSGPNVSLPDGVDPADVTGLAFVFSDSNGTSLPPSTTGGTVPIGLMLRDTVRSTGDPLDPLRALTQNNCASPSALDTVDGTVSGADRCAAFTIQPGTAQIGGSKQFFPDANGSYSTNGFAVAGQQSGVSAVAKVENASAVPVTSMTITDPATSAPTSLDAVDVSQVRLVFPTGATAATGSVTCSDNSSIPITASATGNIPADCPGNARPTRVTVTYSGTIPPGASGQLGVHGTLNGAEVGGQSLQDCADGTIVAGQSSSSGTTCAKLPVENPRTTVGGVKNVSSPLTGGSLVAGYPVTFTVQANNTGNLPQSTFVVNDPAPGTTDANNPFTILRLTSASLTTNPASLRSNFVIEVTTDGGDTWAPYAAGDADLLNRTDGIRARLTSGFVPPTGEVTLTVNALLRDGVPDGTAMRNCQVTNVESAVDTGTTRNVCAPTLTSEPPSGGGDLAKFISPGTLPAPVPGVQPTSQVQMRAQNTGTVPLKRLVIADPDPSQIDPDAFFELVNVTKIDGVNFPPGANRVQVDACISAAACRAGTYVTGTPTASSTPTLPVSAADVAGLRFIFTNANGNFVLTPGSNFPTSGACPRATACFSVTPRTTERDTGDAIDFPQAFSDIAALSGESPLAPGQLTTFGDAPAPLTVQPGTPKLTVDKTADAQNDTTVTPGQPISYSLATTNSGTASLPALLVTEPLPDGLNFDNTFAGDDGNPYKITYSGPAGTSAPPAPQFTAVTDPTTNRITEVRWQFDPNYLLSPTAKITITFQGRLDPTVAAGTKITNTYGATTSDANVKPSLTCATGTPDPTLGCTDSASATEGTGSAVDAQKWVHGDDSRGFYNTRTKTFVPIGDPGCPLLTVDGDNYTRFPCIALVLPGQHFNFLLNLVNVGTTPITETRLIDYLPKVGDRGVVVNGQRETEWDPRPVLRGAPTLASGAPGSLDLAYSATSPTCTTDIDKPPVACPAGTWDPTFSADAEAFRGFLTFATPLPPAGTTRVVIPMSAPADLDTTTNQLPIAWNSFAHSDFFRQPNGSITQLPPVEPEKVGVAMPFGNLEITKTVTGDIPPGSIIGPFRGTYRCVVTTADGDDVVVRTGDAEFSPDAPFTVKHVPAGAVCTIDETDTGGGNPTMPDPVTIVPDVDDNSPTPSIAGITNDFPAPRLIVTKVVSGDAAKYASGPYEVEVDCTLAGVDLPPRKLSFDAAGSQSITDLPIGAQCTVKETDDRGATTTDTSYSDGDHANINALVDGVATLTNTYDPVDLTVTKTVDGPGSAGPYSFAAACTLTSNAGTTVDVPLAGADAKFTLSDGQRHVISVPKGADVQGHRTVAAQGRHGHLQRRHDRAHVGPVRPDHAGSASTRSPRHHRRPPRRPRPRCRARRPADAAAPRPRRARPARRARSGPGPAGGGSSATGSGGLASTGALIAGPTLLAIALLLLGGGLVVAGTYRRRTARPSRHRGH